ncbi:hypothetical protein GE061_001809 [Apolygus lucorum]|uniref:Integrase zinc-binding domain-containing protein n=1 Tax=Apolygus lucorum TaxID=248454 RepID=A0A8S9X526_APOLU|nr:hypothetical protein GE061_001809 [Apolygus lucorum]
MLAKSRVAPIHEITIPRLELLAALIGARIAKTVLDAIQQKVENIYYWTDSTVVLTWLQDPNPWNTFVGNRVREIQKLSKIRQWRHLPGACNLADLPSRGCGGKTLLESKWWEGPGWLKSAKDQWPSSPFFPDESASQEKRSTIAMTVVGEEQFSERFAYFSRYSRIARMVAWVKRFWKSRTRSRKQQEVGQERLIVFTNREGILKIKPEKELDKKAKDIKKIGIIQGLSSEETKEAENRILKVIQFETVDKNETWKRMEVTRNIDELLRVKTKLIYGKFSDNFKNPIILPANHFVVKRLVEERHSRFGHPGVGTLLGMLREDYWILKGRKAVRGVTERCVTCKKLKGKAANPAGAALPEDRQTLGSAFEITGTDLAGPLYLKNGEKVWVVLFTCAVYRAVHCELTSSLSTSGFLMCLRRFIARRGRVSTIYSDNGTNFIGANRLLSSVNWDEICSFSDVRQIRWKCNPPTAAWWGGWWELVVRKIKELMRRNQRSYNRSPQSSSLKTSSQQRHLISILYPLEITAQDGTSMQRAQPSSFLPGSSEDVTSS